MSCLQVPAAMRAWRGLSARLGLRSGHVDVVVQGRQPAGLGRLRKEVRTCEYSDVHVMWEMLSKPSTSSGGKGAAAGATRLATTGRRKPAIVVAGAWSPLAFYCCGII